MMDIVELSLILILVFRKVFGYVEVSITNGQPIFSGSKKVINLDNLRVKKVNHSDHLIVGGFETFLSLGNDFDVS